MDVARDAVARADAARADAAERTRWDAIVIGSGFGGTMAAHELVQAGLRVLLLERGVRVPRGPESARGEAAGPLGPHYDTSAPYRIVGDGRRREQGAFHCVGGPSVFYGGVALRFRAEDFEHDPEIAGASGARWPFGYDALAPWYDRAERLLGVAGDATADPTEPWHDAPYPHAPQPLSPLSARLAAAARSLGLHPFPLPLAINAAPLPGRGRCTACATCDGFACAVGAKNDLATAVLPGLERRGLVLLPGTAVVRLHARGTRLTHVDAIDAATGTPRTFRGDQVILAAGALATPHLLLASGLQRRNPAGHLVGRYLMRHHNSIVFGAFPTPPEGGDRFHKQVGIHDLYFGDPDARVRGRLGGLQQLATPSAALVRAQVPRAAGALLGPLVPHITGLLTIAEDQPQLHNRVRLDPDATDRFGLPRVTIEHRYTERDRAAGAALDRLARRILRRTGAWAFYRHPIHTFSHACGTVRLGADPRSAPLDPDGRFRGVDNLRVTDASAFPTSAAVNPSLTIAANALRIAARLLDRFPDDRSPVHALAPQA